MKRTTEQDYYERIIRTLVYIQQHLDADLDLDQLAAIANFSRFHFHRVFHGLVGESLQQHIRRLRLERAAQGLKHGSEPVIQIALQAGFETHEAFTRAFKAMFETSPSDYRAAHKPAPESLSGTHFDDVKDFHPPDYGDPLQVEVKEIPPMRVIFLRHVGPYSEVGATWARLMSWAGPRGLLGPGMKTIGIVQDDPAVTAADKIRYDACVVVTRPCRRKVNSACWSCPAAAMPLPRTAAPTKSSAKPTSASTGLGCRRAGTNSVTRQPSSSI